jgi:hypothetical protein
MKFNSKIICLIFVPIFICTISVAQVGVGTTTPETSAMLEVKSNTKGFLPPRMTYVQRQSIINPATGLVIFCSDCGPQSVGGELQVYSGGMWRNLMGGVAATTTPTLSATTVASLITSSTATSGGNVVNDGGSTITARGVCWSTSQNPTTANSKTTDGGTTGTFVSSLSNLTTFTTYYVRAYATNATGTTYGTEVSFTTNSVAIGEVYGGGKVAYILQSGDRGYVAGQVHGLIVANVDQGNSSWSNTATYTSATDSAIGSGSSNTLIILNSTNCSNCAAWLCSNYVDGGFSDWYLPSKFELNKLYINRSAIGLTPRYYWSSTQSNTQEAWVQYSGNGNYYSTTKQTSNAVRAVRSF